jgi:3',5'-cyclic-AMP phosphodiesterase
MSHPLRVVQLSDLHFSTAPGGYGLRDTADTFAAIVADVLADPPDLVVVTGDIANEGKPEEYEQAGAALEALGLPVFCLAGNHDFTDALHAHLPRPGIVVARSMRIGEWLFLFGDSNDGGLVFDSTGGWVDHPERMELARGGIHGHELAWLRRQLDFGAAAHAMLWLHHPPAAPGMFTQPDFDAQVTTLCQTSGSTATPLRAIAAGHVHTGIEGELAGTPVYFCPSTGVCIDFEASQLMPPGYRRFEFRDDGTIRAELVWLDDERWNERWPLPDWAVEYLSGRLSDEEMHERRAKMREQSR